MKAESEEEMENPYDARSMGYPYNAILHIRLTPAGSETLFSSSPVLLTKGGTNRYSEGDEPSGSIVFQRTEGTSVTARTLPGSALYFHITRSRIMASLVTGERYESDSQKYTIFI